jgi:hypothetical protein
MHYGSRPVRWDTMATICPYLGGCL